ncbi:MAG TPA: ethanolamine ammonia-lyase reactivating factor EutA [Acidimicrobiales bacterium]|nr:ethanolamine ammonia-lyase reactivating factor EutA [Acidimicrobiales bacterium]
MTELTTTTRGMFSLDQDLTVRLTTVGIDIGSATSQLNFSLIELQRIEARFVVTRRELIYESDIMITPYLDSTTIDTDQLSAFLDEQYAKAEMTNDDIDSGAIILTGLALAKHNSRAIADMFSEHAGKFVAVSAGDAIEATLACRGAGIERISAETGQSIVNIDMGGGTVKYAYATNGKLARVGAIDIGARLITTDADQRVQRIEEPAAMMLKTIGRELHVGDLLDEETLAKLCAYMANEVLTHAGVLPGAPDEPRLLRTPPLFGTDERPQIDAVTFSGGISEYIYDREERTFGDLGRPLADAVMSAVHANRLNRLEPPKGIRATVLGASQYSLQLSGNTVYASHESLLPLRNIPVVKPEIDLRADDLDFEVIVASIRRTLALRERAIDTDAVAIAMQWGGSATYARLDVLARAFLESAEKEVIDSKEVPLIIVCDMDVAGLLGRHIQDLTHQGVKLVTVDGIEVSEFDFLDIGAFVPGTGAMPIVVKSLLFPPQEDGGA